MKIGIIGAGNMGGAIYRELNRVGFNVSIYDHSYVKARSIAKTHAVSTLNDILKRCSCLIIAVKPQSFSEFAAELGGRAKAKLIISIMAGVKIKTIIKLIGSGKVVRTIPNLPAQVGMGVTEWIASKQISKSEKMVVQKILNSFSLELEVKKEELLGKLIMISGSGPAYFFYLTELLAKQARAFGLNQKDADKIAVATLAGSAQLLICGNKSAADWRSAVTSKSGVTEAALKHLHAKHWDKIFFDALKKGAKRGEELSKIIISK